MLTEDVLAHPARTLTEDQRRYYFENGAVRVTGFVSDDWLARLRAASDEMIERSRRLSENDGAFILEDGHSAHSPRLRRLTSPVSHHPTFWDFAANSPIADAVADVVGPDVKFYHSKLNYKWSGGGQRFDWHQDIQAWPHTNYSPVTVGVLLEDCDSDQGPLTVVKGSHDGPLHSMYDENDNWVLSIKEDVFGGATPDNTEAMTGPAGTIFLLNCRTIHGSTTNRSDRRRPLLLYVYSAADAFPYVVNPIPSDYDGEIVRGAPARWAHHDPRPCELPPDWSEGYAGPWTFHRKAETA